jgi:hypothetical protein
MGMEETLKNSVLIAIFVISIVSFVAMFAIDNQSDVVLPTDDARLSGLNATLRSNISSLEDDATTAQDILLKTSLNPGDSEISGAGGQFKTGPFAAIGMAVTSLKTSFSAIFGNSGDFQFVMIAFVALFTFLLGYYVIKAWLGRDPN